MFIHSFAFRWKIPVTDEQKQRVVTEIADLHNHIPGILDTVVGLNTSPRGQGYEVGGTMKFPDRATFEAYSKHPVHDKLLEWLWPLIDPVEVDYEV